MIYTSFVENGLIIGTKFANSQLFPQIGNKIGGRIFGTDKLEKQFQETVKDVQKSSLRVEEKLANVETFLARIQNDPQFQNLLCTGEFDPSLFKK